MTTFDASENLVEESQDWWSRDVGSLNLGNEDWAQGWNSNLPSTSPDWRYDNNIPNIPTTSGPDSNFRPPQSARILTGIPPDLASSNHDPNVTRDSNTPGTMVFPGNFQR
jgi:hypothetical protein